MPSLQYFCVSLSMAIFIVLSLGQASGQWYRKVGDKKIAYYAITVDHSGSGNFTTIQSALNSVPSNNKFWVCIRIKAGIYREKIKIPYDKPYIILKGEGKRKTQVVWDDHETLAESPTFTSLADNIVVKCMSFTNSYNLPPNSNPLAPAAAAMITGDKTKFFMCGFFGLQDTLWDDQGQHYYKLCTIQGAIDFIFGSGQSIFEVVQEVRLKLVSHTYYNGLRCSISVLGEALGPRSRGFITAQGRTNPTDANGFVFKESHVFGSGSAFLGRPWRDYARVFFYNTNFSDVVLPRGWDAWNVAGHEDRLTFAEEGCFGPGSDTSRRVSWEKKLSEETVKQLTTLSFIDSDGWIRNQPF